MSAQPFDLSTFQPFNLSTGNDRLHENTRHALPAQRRPRADRPRTWLRASSGPQRGPRSRLARLPASPRRGNPALCRPYRRHARKVLQGLKALDAKNSKNAKTSCLLCPLGKPTRTKRLGSSHGTQPSIRCRDMRPQMALECAACGADST